jgi:hypothetical protein
MEGMELPKSEMAVLPGKYPGIIYRELSRNGIGGVYTGSGPGGRLDSKPSLTLDCPAPTQKILEEKSRAGGWEGGTTESAGKTPIPGSGALNKQSNGLLRQSPPKKVLFNTLTQEQPDVIVDKLNNRSRKVLGCLTPYEVFSS